MAETHSSGDGNAYFMDSESAAEMGRLLDQDRLLTRGMGGLLVERGNSFEGIKDVLDVGCGPGGWAQEVAFAHPETEVIGIDLSQTMIAYARAQAEVQHLKNLTFEVMDVQQPLEFPDHSFDLVNARLMGFVPPPFWPTLIKEYMRITRPGGLIRLTETEMCVSNSPALEQEMEWFFSSLKRAGLSFSPNGHRVTITAVLAPLLRQVGCHNVQVKAHAVEWSAGSEFHHGMADDMKVGLKLLEPFYQNAGVAAQEEIEKNYEQMLLEMKQDTFGSVYYLLTAYGEKP